MKPYIINISYGMILNTLQVWELGKARNGGKVTQHTHTGQTCKMVYTHKTREASKTTLQHIRRNLSEYNWYV